MLRDNIDNGGEGVHLFPDQNCFGPLFCYIVVDMVLLRSAVEKLYLLQAVFKRGGYSLVFFKAVTQRCEPVGWALRHDLED